MIEDAVEDLFRKNAPGGRVTVHAQTARPT